jgi:hypothetical protein
MKYCVIFALIVISCSRQRLASEKVETNVVRDTSNAILPGDSDELDMPVIRESDDSATLYIGPLEALEEPGNFIRPCILGQASILINIMTT